MKKLVIGILASALVLASGTVGVMAAGPDKEAAPAAVAATVPDNLSSAASVCPYTDADGDGVCDNAGACYSNHGTCYGNDGTCYRNGGQHADEEHRDVYGRRHAGTHRQNGHGQSHSRQRNHHR